jgi:pimeloyl-ACP methyl ester carboxylesterase
VHALDLSGHGQSAWTYEYSLDRWADEVAAFVDHVSTPGAPTILIGHSRGGFVALLASERSKTAVDGLVLVESAFDVDPPSARSASAGTGGPTGPPPSRADMLARFEPQPRDVPPLAYAATHIAEQSIIESDGRWRWQFDRAFLGRVKAMGSDQVDPTNARSLQIRGGYGLLTEVTADAVRAALGPASDIIVMPDAGHHIMLQQPRELTVILESTLTAWLRGVQVSHRPRAT